VLFPDNRTIHSGYQSLPGDRSGVDSLALSAMIVSAPVNLKGASRKGSLGSLVSESNGRLNTRRPFLSPMPGAPAQPQ